MRWAGSISTFGEDEQIIQECSCASCKDLDEEITLKWYLKELSLRVWAEFIWPRACRGDRGSTVCYKSEGRWIDPS